MDSVDVTVLVICVFNSPRYRYKEAEKLMETMEQGDVIFRPSSKGDDRLTVTWKVAENVYQHIDIKEEGKINSFSLGTSLWIGNEEYEDLDEIMARFINPVNRLLLMSKD